MWAVIGLIPLYVGRKPTKSLSYSYIMGLDTTILYLVLIQWGDYCFARDKS